MRPFDSRLVSMLAQGRRYLDVLHLRLRSLFSQQRADRDLARELRAHLDEEIAANVAAGMTPAEARRAAARAFGSIASVEERCRETRRVQRVQNLVRDVRYAVRTLARQPGLVAAAAISMALGVGANLTIVSLANSLLFAMPSAARPEELVLIRVDGGSHVPYTRWKQLNDSGAVAGLAGYQFEQSVNWRNGAESRTLVPMLVTANYFDLLGVPVALGRGFTSAEAAAERRPRLVVVSHGFWQRQLQRDPSIVGRALVLNGEPYTVTGVLDAGHRCISAFGLVPDVYLPLNRELLPWLDDGRSSAVQLVGRLRPGQSLAEGRAASDVAAARLIGPARRGGGTAVTLFEPVGGLAQTRELPAVAPFFLILFIVSGLVLAIACANVAGLLIARGLSRRREMALRLALGAGRWRLVQQLLVESLVLAAIGAAAGGAVTAAVFRLLSTVSLPVPIPVELHFARDWRIAALAVGLVLASTIMTGLAPALQATRAGLLRAIKLDEHRITILRRRFTLRSVLVAGQVAGSLVVLVTALLFTRSLVRAATVETGVDADRVLVARISFVEGRQGSAGRLAVESIVERVRALPGVAAAAFSDGVPLTIFAGSRSGTDVSLEGRAEPVRVEYDSNRVGPGYFATMGIRVLRGRDFTGADRVGRAEPIVVNDEFARRYFAGLDPIGRHMGAREIIGVVTNGKYRSLSEAQDAAIYEPMVGDPSPDRLVHLLVRTTGAPRALEAAVQSAVLASDASAAVTLMPMRDALAFALLPSRAGSAALGLLGGLGTFLAMVGLFGVVSFAVSRRTPEIAIRLALGASERAVVRLVIEDAGRLVVAGLVAGLALAWLITAPLSAFLVAGVSPSDLVSFAAAALLLLVACLSAIWAPALRALRIPPATALKVE